MWTYREKVTYEVYDQETGYVTGHYDQEFEAAEAAHTINTYDRRAMDNAAAKKAQEQGEAQEGDGAGSAPAVRAGATG